MRYILQRSQILKRPHAKEMLLNFLKMSVLIILRIYVYTVVFVVKMNVIYKFKT